LMGSVLVSAWSSRLAIMWFVRTTRSEAAAAARIGARLGARKRRELLGLLRPCFARPEPWLQVGKYLSALASGLPKRNGWTIAEHAGDRAPDRTQRLLNRATWDTSAAMGAVRRFAVAGLEETARRSGRRRGLVIGALDETGQEKAARPPRACSGSTWAATSQEINRYKAYATRPGRR
jgi:hypothetical protein